MLVWGFALVWGFGGLAAEPLVWRVKKSDPRIGSLRDRIFNCFTIHRGHLRDHHRDHRHRCRKRERRMSRQKR